MSSVFGVLLLVLCRRWKERKGKEGKEGGVCGFQIVICIFTKSLCIALATGLEKGIVVVVVVVVVGFKRALIAFLLFGGRFWDVSQLLLVLFLLRHGLDSSIHPFIGNEKNFEFFNFALHQFILLDYADR
jgi:hypothetical protein